MRSLTCRDGAKTISDDMRRVHPAQMTDIELDWAVARALGLDIVYSPIHDRYGVLDAEDPIALDPLARYSTDWGAGGPLLDQFQVSLTPDEAYESGEYETWTAETHVGRRSLGRHRSQLRAAMEAVVGACIGIPVAVPAALRDRER